MFYIFALAIKLKIFTCWISGLLEMSNIWRASHEKLPCANEHG